MDKRLKESYDKYVEFSKVIKDMYLKIINYEINDDTENAEYKAIFDVLPSSVKYENKYLKQMNLGPSNIKYIKQIIDYNLSDLPVKIMNLDSDELDRLRRSNKTDEVMISINSDIEIPDTVSNIMELIRLKNDKIEYYNMVYADSFFYVIVNNIIKLTDDRIKEEPNKVIRDYLINIKYRLIATTPRYEDNYLFFNRNALPFLTFDSIYMENFESNQIIDLSFNSVREGLLSDITDLMNAIDSGNWNIDYVLIAERCVITNQARLIALNDSNLIDLLEEEMIPFILLTNSTTSSYGCTSKLFGYINRIFEGARNIIINNKKRTL